MLFPGCNRRGRHKLLVIIPYSRGASIFVAILLLHISLVGRSEQLKKVEFERPGVKLAENRVRIVDLGVPLLEEDHAIEKLHIRAPPGYSFEAFLRVADFSEEF